MFGGGTNDTAVSAEEFEEMRNELENLKEEHQDVTAELEEVTTDFDALQEEYDTLNNNHKELIEKRDQVDAENSRLQDQLAKERAVHETLKDDLETAREELLNFKRSQSTLIEDIETKISNLKSQAKTKSGDLDKLSSLLALTLNGSDLKKSYEVQYELKKMKTIIETEKQKAIDANDNMINDRRMFQLQISKLKSKLSKVMLGSRGDMSLTVDKLRKELVAVTSQLQQLTLDKNILQQKFDNLVESTQQDLDLNDSLHKEEGGFSIGDIDTLTNIEIEERLKFIQKYMPGVLQECGYDMTIAEGITSRMNNFTEDWWSERDLIESCTSEKTFTDDTLTFSGKKNHPEQFKQKIKKVTFFKDFENEFVDN
eukprot:g11248.t1